MTEKQIVYAVISGSPAYWRIDSGEPYRVHAIYDDRTRAAIHCTALWDMYAESPPTNRYVCVEEFVLNPDAPGRVRP